ncbi:MAG TPA: hypothetical protein VGX70_06830 [Gemmataceae bacterium]|jgi:hypothetical protein|nr:hypothetical protein [Gemmataceae bacterium]
MNPAHEDRYEVYVRFDPDHSQPPPDTIERPLACCSTYEEAKRIRQSFHGLNGQCLIRFVGSSGGGD